MRSALVLAPSLTAIGGGIEQHARHLVGALAAEFPDARLSVVLGREPVLARPALLPPSVRERIVVRGADGPRPLRIARMTASAARAAAARPAWVIAQHLHYAPLGLALARATGARLAVVAHGFESWSPRPLGRLALERADRVLCVSGFTRDALLRWSLDAGRLRVIPNAVDLDRFSPGAPPASVAERIARLPKPRVLAVTRLDFSYKGIDRLIEALRRMHPRPSLIVAGDGAALERLRAQAARAGVDAQFWGAVSDEELLGLYRAADLFALPSSGEGFGYVFIEALACGLPVVGGNRDGSVEALADGALGLLCDPRDPDSISRAIAAQLDGTSPPALRDRARLRAEVAARFSLLRFRSRLAEALAPAVA